MLKKHTITTLMTALGLAAMASAPALADGDAAAGAKVFNKCKTCHITSGEGKRLGPSLECIIGRTSGTLEGFRFSPAMAGAGVVWSHEAISEYLKNPKAFIPGNKMTFPGLRDDQQIADLLAYLEQETATANCPK